MRLPLLKRRVPGPMAPGVEVVVAVGLVVVALAVVVDNAAVAEPEEPLHSG